MKKCKLEDLFFTQWAQLSIDQMADVVALNEKAKELWSQNDNKKWGIHVIAILRRLRRKPRLVEQLVESQIPDILNAIKILHEPWYEFPVREFNLTPTLSGREGVIPMIAPEEKMHNLTWDHFMYADKEFSLYMITENIEHIHNLIAVLYYPSRKEGNRVYQGNALDYASAIAKKLTVNEKRLIMITYGNIRQFIFKRCKYLFGGGDSKTQLKPTGAIWLKWKHYLAETPAFQGMDKAGAAPLYSALDYLNDLEERKATKTIAA